MGGIFVVDVLSKGEGGREVVRKGWLEWEGVVL
jgi:hypothetical protein